MINLLSIEEKRDIQAARLNVQLTKYILMIVGGIIFLSVIFLVGYFITSGERHVAEVELSARKQEAAEFGEVQKEAEQFAKNLIIARSILANEIIYSELLIEVANSLPAGVILNSFVIDNTLLASNKPITLNAEARSYDDVLRLKSTLENSALFEKVNLGSIEEKPIAPGQPLPPYPFDVQVNVSVTNGSLQKLGVNQ